MDDTPGVSRPAQPSTGSLPRKPRQPRPKSLAWVKEVADRAEGKAPAPRLRRGFVALSFEEASARAESAPPEATARAARIAAEEKDLPAISEKERRFVYYLVASGLPATQAYVKAFGRGTYSDVTLRRKASDLQLAKRIQAWKAALTRAGLTSTILTVEQHMQELAALRQAAVDSDQIAAAVQAEVHRGKAAGLYHDSATTIARAGDADLLAALEGALGRAVAAQILAGLGVSVPRQIDGTAVEVEAPPAPTAPSSDGVEG